jgi:hypothetical protein
MAGTPSLHSQRWMKLRASRFTGRRCNSASQQEGMMKKLTLILACGAVTLTSAASAHDFGATFASRGGWLRQHFVGSRAPMTGGALACQPALR